MSAQAGACEADSLSIRPHAAAPAGLCEPRTAEPRWALTAAGKLLVTWVEESIENQKKILLGDHALRISSTSWLIEQFLIPNLKDLKTKFPSKLHIQLTTTEKKLETHLIEGACDFVIVCHPPEDPAIAHRQLFKEEWSVIFPSSWKEKNHKINFQDLLKRPFIRHGQINPDLFGLNSHELSEMTSLTVDNLIAVRAAVKEGEGWSIVPSLLVSGFIKSKEILRADHPVEMDRKLCLWWPRNRAEAKKQSALLASWLLESHS